MTEHLQVFPLDVDPPCPTCLANGRRGYCALGRCYCGHPDCHGFASWVDIRAEHHKHLDRLDVVSTGGGPRRAARRCPSGRIVAADGECCGRTHPVTKVPGQQGVS